MSVKQLIRVLAVRSIVEYQFNDASPTNVIDLHAGAVRKYQNEITSLVAGAVLYALAIKRLAGEVPVVPLSPSELETAAAILRKHPDKAKAFRRLLKLRNF